MALGINTNLASLSAQRALNNTQSDTNTAMQRLSTGLRINSAKDDAAGMAVASRFTSQISGMQQASRNASDAVSMLQTAEGGLQSITDNLQRIRELAVQAASDSISDTDRGYLHTEVAQLVTEIDRVADTTKYNGTTLLDGTYVSSGLTFQVGADNSNNDRMTVTIGDFNKVELGQSKAATTGALTLTGAATGGDVTLKVGSANAVDIGAVSGNGLATKYKAAVDAVAGVSATVGSTVTKTVGVAQFTQGASTTATTGALTLTGAATGGDVTLKVGSANAVDIGAVSGNGLATKYKAAVDAVAGVSATVGSTVTKTVGVAQFTQGASTTATTGALTLTGAATSGDVTLKVGSANAADIGTVSSGVNGLAASYKTAVDAVAGVSATVGSTVTQAIGVAGFTAGTGSASTYQLQISVNGQDADIVQSTTSTVTAADINTAFGTYANNTAGITVSGDAAAGTLVMTDTQGRDISFKATLTANNDTGTGGAITYNSSAVATDGTETAKSYGKLTITNTTDAALIIGGNAETKIGATDNQSFAASSYKLEISVDGVDADIVQSRTTTITAADINTAFSTYASNTAGITVSGDAAAGTLVMTDTQGRDISFKATMTAGTDTGAGGAVTYNTSAVANDGTATDKSYGKLTITTAADAALVIGGAAETKIGATADQSFAASTRVANTGVDQISVTSRDSAQTAIDIVDRALLDVSSGRATMGAFQSRFDSVVANLNLGAENATAGRSRVQDADFAVESANLAKNQVLQQAGMSVLAQANALPQQVLALLQ